MVNTMKYYGGTPFQEGVYTVGHQRLADVEEEIRPLHEAHFNETETAYLDAEFHPAYERYKESEQRGQFVLFTVRENSTLVGYLQYYVFRDMHAAGMFTAREDAFYLTPSCRGKGLARPTLSYAEHFLQKLGCRYVGMSSKAPAGGPDIGDFLASQGYRAVATYYVKELEN